MWELFCQAGPVVNVYLPKDRVTNAHQGYGFVEFRAEEDADYVSTGMCCCCRLCFKCSPARGYLDIWMANWF